jgi:hypothetical protein
MVYFHTQNPKLVIFWKTLELIMLEYFRAIWYIWLNFIAVRYILLSVVIVYIAHFDMLYHEKSGNPERKSRLTEISPKMSH